MAKYRKKPVVIEATQWFRDGDHSQVHPLPSERRSDQCFIAERGHHPDVCGWIQTEEGGHIVMPGDWIITGIQGEHYACKPYIFEQTYEPV